MAYPIRGCLVDKVTGKISTAWDIVGAPNDQLEQFLPMISDLNGKMRPEYDPTIHVIMDLTAEVDPGDLEVLYKEMSDARLFQDQTTRRWTFKKRIREGDLEIEIEHPLEQIMAGRRRLRELRQQAVTKGNQP